jgi:selenium metabolism protein YedF
VTAIRFHSALVMTGDTFGRGDDNLGRILMTKFVRQLSVLESKPEVVIFYNTAVRLLSQDSPYLEVFREMEHAGVELFACGTCAEHFGLTERIGAGRVTDMREIAATMLTSDRVVTV